MQSVNMRCRCKRLINGTVCMEFRVSFTSVKYKNGILSLIETSPKFIHDFCPSRIQFHKTGLLNVIKFSRLQYGIVNQRVHCSHTTGSTKRHVTMYD